MPDILVERGIGETRLITVDKGEIVEARILLEGVPRAGSGQQVVLKRVGPPAIAADGAQEYVLPKGAPGVTEGAAMIIEITREAIPGTEPWKRPMARLADGIAVPLLEGEAIPFPASSDRLAEAGWWDLIEEARSGIIRFDGGELRVSPTPAMTLIDVDGRLPPAELAIAAARAAAQAIRRHGIGGSIGIDFPTVAGKAQRQAIAETIDRHLPPPFERTAVNGFGFLQIVRPRRHASLFELASDRVLFEARTLMRHAATDGPGGKILVAHPALIEALRDRPAWLERLGRQVGGTVELRAEPKLPMSGGYATSL